MSARALAVVTWLASASACTPSVEPRSEEPHIQAVAEPALAEPSPDHAPPVPDIADILYEDRWSSTRGVGEATAGAGATFPRVSIYADGTVLHMILDGEPGFALGRARLDSGQLDQLRARIDALAPVDRLQAIDLLCRRDPFVGGVVHGVSSFRVRSGDEQVCFVGCPKQPESLGAAFLELFDLVESFGDLDYQPWVSDHGHVVAMQTRGAPTPPWSEHALEPGRPRAWPLPDERSFALAWDQAGGRVGPIVIRLESESYNMSVVPWRPGEDRSEEVDALDELYDEYRGGPSPCPLGTRVLTAPQVR